MRKWGLVITLFYGLIVVALLVPVMIFLASDSFPSGASFKEAYSSGIPWICAGIVMLSEFLLLWLSVDTTQRRLKPRTHILVSAVITGLLMTILTAAIVMAVGFGVWGEKFFKFFPDSPNPVATLSAFVIPWLVWGILFYRLCRNSTDPVTRAVAWLFRGSVLELLIAVPAHVVMRRRHDCSAPVVNSFGITTGLAIMLLSFGPSVLLLYKKRMERYSTKSSGVK
jgi:hypothetical protein